MSSVKKVQIMALYMTFNQEFPNTALKIIKNNPYYL